MNKYTLDRNALIYIERLETAFFQITSAISAHGDLNKILEVIIQESLKCLKAHRSTVFLMDEKGGALKTQFTYVSDPLYEFLLKIFMPDDQEPIEVVSKVVWTNKYGNETKGLRRGMGVKFLRLQPEAQKRIEEHIKSHKNEITPNLVSGSDF